MAGRPFRLLSGPLAAKDRSSSAVIALAIELLGRASGFVKSVARKEQAMMRPDHYYAIMLMMKYGSLAFALVFAVKIAAFAYRSIQ
jgi:hypothetical protein